MFIDAAISPGYVSSAKPKFMKGCWGEVLIPLCDVKSRCWPFQLQTTPHRAAISHHRHCIDKLSATLALRIEMNLKSSNRKFEASDCKTLLKKIPLPAQSQSRPLSAVHRHSQWPPTHVPVEQPPEQEQERRQQVQQRGLVLLTQGWRCHRSSCLRGHRRSCKSNSPLSLQCI